MTWNYELEYVFTVDSQVLERENRLVYAHASVSGPGRNIDFGHVFRVDVHVGGRPGRSAIPPCHLSNVWFLEHTIGGASVAANLSNVRFFGHMTRSEEHPLLPSSLTFGS